MVSGGKMDTLLFTNGDTAPVWLVPDVDLPATIERICRVATPNLLSTAERSFIDLINCISGLYLVSIYSRVPGRGSSPTRVHFTGDMCFVVISIKLLIYRGDQ